MLPFLFRYVLSVLKAVRSLSLSSVCAMQRFYVTAVALWLDLARPGLSASASLALGRRFAISQAEQWRLRSIRDTLSIWF